MSKHIDNSILESFEAPEQDHTITFETDELTAHCPFDFGGPDFYKLTIQYQPQDEIVESRSLKRYIESWRGVEVSAEELATTIHQDIDDTVSPEWLYISLQQSRRGGIEETVEVGHVGN